MSVEKGVKFDDEKPQWGLLPFKQVEQVVDVLTFGAKKYSPDNWKKVPEAERRYFDAMMRHIAHYKYDSKLDDETGKSHLAHAICCALFLMGFDDGEGIKLDDNDMPLKEVNTGGIPIFDLNGYDKSIVAPIIPTNHFIGTSSIVEPDKKSPHKCTLDTVDMSPIDGVLNNIKYQLEQGKGTELEASKYITTLNDGGVVYLYDGLLSDPFKYIVTECDNEVISVNVF